MVDGWNTDNSGNNVTYRHFVNGHMHREDGPAVIIENKYGEVTYNAYCFKGEWHREDGFAREWFRENGSSSGSYYLNGVRANENQELLIKLNILLK